VTSTRFVPPAPTAQVIQDALRKHAATWIQRFYRHEILVARTVRGLQQDAVETFRIEVVGPLVRQLAAELAGFPDRGADVTINATPQLRRMIQQAEAIVRAGVAEVERQVRDGLRQVVDQETLWVQESAEKVLQLPQARQVDAGQVWRIVQDRPYLGGQVQEWFDSFVGGDNGAVDNIRYAVQTGIQRGWSTDETVRALRGTKAGGFTDGLLTREQPAQLYALVRTAATHASTAAREASFEALGVDRYRFIATLDSRTSIQCAANDGKIFEMGKGPLPPLHPSCRSTIVPYIGEPIGNRASVDGPVPAETNFRGWLEGQPISVQNEVLGPTRAAAWRAGDLSFEDMVGRDLTPLSVQRLRELDRIPTEPEED
jgi:SPP1 gp7 family putative phage head morphogenesis protein